MENIKLLFDLGFTEAAWEELKTVGGPVLNTMLLIEKHKALVDIYRFTEIRRSFIKDVLKK